MPVASSAPPRRILRIADLEDIFDASERTIRRWCKLRDPLPALRLGPRRIAFLESDVFDWVARQRVSPPARQIRRLSKAATR
jgi:predicted DNA-binding transcriptional regulator AlpA